jgi:Uma2 family endonuclease
MRLKTRRSARIEYERLPLLDGRLVVREPQDRRHDAAVAAVREVLARGFGPGSHVRGHAPVALDDTSEPEADLVVVSGAPWDDAAAHPSTPLLVVEVAETSLVLDSRRKGSLYARAGIRDYWILNLVDLVLEVYRQPARAAVVRHGWEYRSAQVLTRDAAVSPLGAPEARIDVADLLPPRELRSTAH